MKRLSIAALSSSTPALATVSRDGDVVKRGCLYVKRPPSDSTFKLRLKAWQKRYLVLRDSWTDDTDTSLELYACSDTDSSKCHAVNLRHVMFVDVYHDSKSFPHAFIVFRTNKSPLIFAAKTDREMREWMMAIKLLAEKLTSDRTPVTAPIGGMMTPTRGVATRRMSQQPSQHLLHVSRRDDVTRRSSPQLQTISSPAPRWSAAESYPVSVEAHNDRGMRFSPHAEYALTISDNDVTLRPTYATSIIQDGGDGDVIVRWRLAEIRKLKCESVSNGSADLITLVATRSGSRDPVTYTFRTTCGLAIIHCVRQVDSQTSQSTPPSVDRSKRRPSANLLASKLTSSSVDVPAADAQRGGMKGVSCSRSQPDLLSATNASCAQSTVTSTNNSSNLATTTSHRQQTFSSNAQRAAFYTKLTSDDTTSCSHQLITSKSFSDITDNNSSEQRSNASAAAAPRPPPRPLHTMYTVNI